MSIVTFKSLTLTFTLYSPYLLILNYNTRSKAVRNNTTSYYTAFLRLRLII